MTHALSDSGKSSVVLQMPERGRERSGLSLVEIPLEKISYSPYQTREILSEEVLESLSHSIRENGVLQPIIVRMITRAGDLSEQYELVAGERRLRAARMAGLESVPAVVRDLDERSAAEVSVIENAQRENLDPIEEALAYKQLIDNFNLNQSDVGKIVGRDRSTISNSLRLLQLDQRIQIILETGAVERWAWKSTIYSSKPRKQFRFADRAVREHLSVHALEKTRIQVY